jgi:hypothetical protein
VEPTNKRAEAIASIVGAVVFRAIWFLVWFSLPFVAHNR